MAPGLSSARYLLGLGALFLYVTLITGQGSPPRFEYCAVCPPSHRDDLNLTACNITMLSRVDVEEITIETATSTQRMALQANVSLTTTVDPQYQVDQGLEPKGIIISSEEELVITVIKLDMETTENRFIDAYQVYDRRLAGYEYFVLNKLNGCNNTAYVKSFFSVLSFEDSTFIEIYDTDGIFQGASVINRFQVFTQRTTVMDDDFSGMRVKVSKPGLVVTGTLCAGNGVNGITESYITSLQPTLFYGEEYVTPVIAGSITASYGLRVLASEPFTVVEHEGDTVTLNRGEYLEFEYEVNDLATRFSCSKPCLVIQWSDGDNIGNFLFNVFALAQFTRIASFVTLDFEGEHWVSIVVSGFPPMDDVFLDGRNLFDETWKVRSSYSYTELQITTGIHQIHIGEGSGKTFGAYVYCHIEGGTGGYGYSVFPQDLINLPSPPTTEITTPDPGQDYEYVVACPPHQSTSNPELSACEISITAATENALVNISTAAYFMQVNVAQFTPYLLTLNHTFITTQGHENKAVLIRSTSQLTVVMYKLDLSATNADVFIDATQIYSLQIAGFEHYIMAPANGCPGSSQINSYYSLAGHWDGTFVEIFDEDNEFMEAVVLNTYQVYTVYSTEQDRDFSGRYMRSIYPVTAIAGVLCMQDRQQDMNGTYFTSLPAVIHYGYNFTTPNLHLPFSGGFGIRVLASQDFTRVNWGEDIGNTVILSSGEATTIDFPIETISTPITCNRPCLVEQFTKSVTGIVVGNFLFNVIPTEQFYQDAYFTTSEHLSGYAQYISVVVQGLPPMTDILLDNQDLNDVTWRWFGQYTYTDIELTEGRHHLTSLGTKKFAVYVYSHTGNGGGFGYPIWPDGLLVGSTGSPPTIPPTRAPLPAHVITINGTSETSTGLPPEDNCEQYYRLTMRLRGSEIADDVNEGLGTSFCVAIEGNIVIASVEVEIQITGSVVRTDIAFTIPGQKHHRSFQLETCAEEIAVYLVNMNNWRLPLVPGQQDCAPLEFNPERFDQKSLLWQCAEDMKVTEELFLKLEGDEPEKEEGEEEEENDMSYGLDDGVAAAENAPQKPPVDAPLAENDLFFTNTLSQTLETDDDTEISSACREDYRAVVEQMAADMVDFINTSPITNCSNSGLLSVDTEFTTFRNEAFLSYHFISEPGTETFQEMEDCFDDFEEYLVQNVNWGDPLVPPVGGCPELNTQGDEFEPGSSAWLCLMDESPKQ